ncbi:MAG: group III truncated hemoglobin [Amnibacterium sp.]
MRDLADRDDVAVLVEAFYRRAMTDPLLGPVFTDVARLDLDHHLPIITDFWDTVLFAAGTYRRNLLALHAAIDRRAPLTAAHFARWLALWTATIDERFEGEVAERAKAEARHAAATIGRRLRGGSGSLHETLVHREAYERR